MSNTQVNGATQIKPASVGAAQVDATLIKAAGTNPFTGDQSLGGFKLTNVGAPTGGTDAANKAYVDNAVVGLFDYKGGIDASANPNYPAALKGDVYKASVAGRVGGAAGKQVDIGDMIVANADNAGGTEAAVGTSWDVYEHNLVGVLLAANNLTDLTDKPAALTNLGGTTVGKNIFTAANPTAIRFLRINADNTITFLDAAGFRTAIGATGGTKVTRETPAGTINGSNTDFTLANTPVVGSEEVFVNGILQDAGGSNDYTISGAGISFLTGAIPQTGDKIRVSYTF